MAVVDTAPSSETSGDTAAARSVALVGADGPLARRVEEQLRTRTAFDVIELADDVSEVDVVVDLGSSDYDRRAERRESATESCSATLDVAERLGADHVVFVSSALVYGASPNNPVPITEEAVLRPDVEFVFARQLASAEELVEQWRRAHRDRATTVLRPVLALAEGESSRLARALVAGLGWRFAVADPPAQFLHLDDLAAAVGVAIEQRLDGVYNVAPDGWVAGERVRALSGERPRVPVPDRVRDVLGRLSWRFQRGPIPPGLAPYTQASWVVANGRLRTRGWRPTITNEQTYVEATEAPWWTMITPKRRQELTLGTAVIAAIAGVVGAVWLGRVISRRRARRPR
ncbi:MAG: NAD-dependent epimerase/dehydratase family protein [Ilumatobacteraceae bacterium]|nr:NAD-dependent epimerase/dehydratase family protein [Ilumatobacteraceae bacterium]